MPRVLAHPLGPGTCFLAWLPSGPVSLGALRSHELLVSAYLATQGAAGTQLLEKTLRSITGARSGLGRLSIGPT